MRPRYVLLLPPLLLWLSACASGPFKEHKGDPVLKTGLAHYENGDYRTAARSLQTALDAGLSADNQIKAHKYLAFIHCTSNREKACREEFRKAFELDPSFELGAGEVGHPLWGPVYRNLRNERKR